MIKKRSLFMAIVITAAALFAAFPASAAQVNSHDVKKGDTVSFDVHAIACPTKIQAVDFSIYYDSASLSYIDGSLETPSLKGTVTNTDIEGEIRVNAIILDGVDMMEDSTLASVEFKVKDDAADSISLYYEVKNFLDDKKTELHDTYTYDVTRVNVAPDETAVSSNEDPVSSKTESKAASSAAASSKAESAVESDSEEEIIFEMPTEEASEESDSSRLSAQSDIPADQGIRFDTLDTPKPNTKAKQKKMLMLALCGIGILVLAVTAVIIMVRDRGGKGSHFSE